MALHSLRRDTRGQTEARQRQSWTVLVLLCVAQFMVILDMTVVNVALPSIGRSLHFAPSDLQWVITTYLLATGGLTLLGGRAADLMGRRRMFMAGLALFTAASLASGLAPDAAALIVSRTAQGVGAALLTPAALATVTATYTGAQRAAALSVWGGLAGGGMGVGVLAGGVLATWFGWRSVFLINVPVGLAAAVAALYLLPPSPAAPTMSRRLDLSGAVLATSGLVAFVYAITGTPQYGWGSARTLLLLALSAGLLAAFGVLERRVREPLLPLGALRSRSLVTGGLLLLAATGILVGVLFLSSLYLQNVAGDSPVRAGLEFLPLVLMTGLGTHLASRYLQRAGSRVLAAAGLAVIAGGALALSRATARADYLSVVLPGFVLLGLGTGLVFPSASVTAMSRVRGEMAGLASGLLTTAHEVGAGLGAAVFSAVAAAAAGFTAFGGGFADGYRLALAVAAAAAAGLAVITALAAPAVRPSPGAKVAFH